MSVKFLRAALRALTVCPLLLALGAQAQIPSLPSPSPLPDTSKQLALPLPPPNPAAPPQLTTQDVTAFLDGFIPVQLQRDDVAGATVSIVQNGQILLLKGYGYADWKAKTPVDPVKTTFRPGSISKLFTYVAMMQMVEQGKLDLDANIQRYLDFPIQTAAKPIGDTPITLRNLATHTAGFEEVDRDLGSDKSGRLPMDLRTYLVRNQPVRFAAPGKRLAYSNYGIALIGYIVQRVSGEPFESYIEQHIFTPLGMTHSTFRQPLPAGFLASKGYLTTTKPDTGFEGWTPVPAGALSSTAADMAIFGQMLLAHGSFQGHTILQPASVTTLFTPQFVPAPGVNPWDLGFYDDDRNGLRFIGHGGDLIACHSQFWVEPTHGLVFFISYNSAGAAKNARAELFQAFVDRYLPGHASHPAYVKLSAADLKPYTGSYLSARRSDSTKTRFGNLFATREVTADKDGNLMLSTAKDFRNHPMKFRPIGKDNFYEENEQLTVHFTRDAQGRVDGTASPSRSDRVPMLLSPTILMPLLLGSLLTVLLVALAMLVRLWRRLFYRRRVVIAPQPGTRWLTTALKLACLGSLLVLIYVLVVVHRLGEIDNFYSAGHVDAWLMGQNVLSALAIVLIFFGVVSGLRALKQPMRTISRVKFVVTTFACLYLGWVMVFFHFIGSAHRY